MANAASWTNVYKRINEKRKEKNLSWNELAKEAGIKVKTWMTGLVISHPTEDEVRAIAPVVDSTYTWLRYGVDSIE